VKIRCFLAICVFIFLLIGPVSAGLLAVQEAGASDAMPSYDGSFIAMSLRVLSKKAADCLSSRASVPRDLATLCGITRFESYLVDEGSQDVILLGKPVGGGSSSRRPGRGHEGHLAGRDRGYLLLPGSAKRKRLGHSTDKLPVWQGRNARKGQTHDPAGQGKLGAANG